jgi:glycosyltransferase involved in cell wall biosynthesis
VVWTSAEWECDFLISGILQSAVIHDWLVSPVGGSEKCLEKILQLFPSPLYTLVQNKKKLAGTFFESLHITSSFLQKMPKIESAYRNYLPLFPLAIEQFDLRPFDLILSSSHCVAKGVLTHPGQLHICYCHTPMRYAWDLMHEYLQDANLNSGIKAFFVKAILHYLRGWDVHTSSRVDHFIANSQYVAKRIKKFYQREAHVIYPGVNLSYYEIKEKKEDYYVAASRFISYKKMKLIVEAFSQMPDRKLVVIGDGPEWAQVKKIAAPHVELLGYQPDSILKDHLQRAKAFIFAAREDFGILPVEAMGCGTPVIAFGQGGVLETVVDGQTGLFFKEQTVSSLIDGVKRFERMEWDPKKCRERAEVFSETRFNLEFKSFVLEKYSEFFS